MSAEEMLQDLRRWQAVGEDATTVLKTVSPYSPGAGKEEKSKRQQVAHVDSRHLHRFVCLGSTSFYAAGAPAPGASSGGAGSCGPQLEEAEQLLAEQKLKAEVRSQVYSFRDSG